MEKINLTEEQKKFIDDNYKKISNLNELTCTVFMGESLDGRTKEGRAVREYMAGKDYKYKTTKKEKVPEVKLTKEHKEFILAQADGMMKAFDIAKLLFPEKDMTPLSKETLVIAEFLKNNLPEELNPKDSALGEKYNPINSFDAIVETVNKVTHQNLDKNKMQMNVKKGLEALVSFLKSPRLIQTIGNYTDKEDRDLFEAEFIRATWDKADLTSDELNLYINVCIDYINLKNIQKAVDKLNHMFN